jgi:heptosyltransferase-2
MWLDKQATQQAELLWQEAFPHQAAKAAFKVIGLNIGASWPTKRWPKESFARLADCLLELGYGVVYLGGAMDQELVAEAITLMQRREDPNLACLTGKMSLLELAAVLKKCTVIVTNDSGPMHVAVAMAVPLVAMFGASPVTGFYPYNDLSVVLKTSAPCHPCGRHHCDTLECMYAITVEEVLDKTLELSKKY